MPQKHSTTNFFASRYCSVIIATLKYYEDNYKNEILPTLRVAAKPTNS
jgi:hypothetical protein